jgi:hypothetical protein
MTEKRKQIESLVDRVLRTMDPTGVNADKYKTMFGRMNDKAFGDWMDRFLADPKSNLRIDITEFDHTRTLKFSDSMKCGKEVLHFDPFEYVYIPHVSSNPNRPIRTKTPVLVGYLNIKRPQQMVSKKTGLSINDTNRDEQTGNLRGESKGGTTTGIENELLAGVGGESIISEICGARGDNVREYDNMVAAISETGSVRLEDIKTNVYDKPTLLQTDLYLMAMGLKTDLISESYYSIDKMRAAMEQAK